MPPETETEDPEGFEPDHTISPEREPIQIETVRLEHLEIGPDSQVVFILPADTPASVSIQVAEEVGRLFPDRSMVMAGDVEIEVIDSAEG